MINKAIIIGNLGRDPETKYTKNGDAVCSFSVATKSMYNNEERTEWHNVVVFKKAAEACGKYLKKGSLVYVEGFLRTEKFNNKDGIEKQITKIVSEKVQFLSKNVDSGQSGDFEDDIPF